MGIINNSGSRGRQFTQKVKGLTSKFFLTPSKLPAGYEVRSLSQFRKEVPLLARVQAKKLNDMGIRGTKAAEVKTLFRIHHATAILGADTHIGACTKDTALLLARFIKKEATQAPTNPHAILARYSDAEKKFIREGAENLEKRALAKKVTIDDRFIKGKEPFGATELNDVIRDAEFVLRGKATKQSEIISVNPLLLMMIRTIAAQKLQMVLGQEALVDIESTIATARTQLRRKNRFN